MRRHGRTQAFVIALATALLGCGPSGGGAASGGRGGGAGGSTASGGAPGSGGAGTAAGGTAAGGASPATGGSTGRGGATGSGGSAIPPPPPGDAGRVSLNGRKALLIVGSTSSLDDGELLLQQVLDEHGMTVTVAGAAGPAAMATGQNVVIASDQADAATVAATFGSVSVPLIAFGNSHFVSLGWIAKNAKGTVDSSTALTIGDAGTPLASDFKAGQSLTAVLASASGSFYWGTPGGAAIQVAAVTGAPAEAVVFGYETGASTGAATAPARRVGLGFKINMIQDLTVDGFKLLEAALDWTAGM